MAQGAGDIAFTHPGRAGDDDVEMFLDPGTRGQGEDGLFVQPSMLAEVDILYRCGQPELGLP